VVSREDRHNRCPIVDTCGKPRPAPSDRAHSRRRATKPGSPRGPFSVFQPEWSTRRASRPAAMAPAHRAQAMPSMPAPSTATLSATKRLIGATSSCYFTGDGARQDADGYFWLWPRGRCDQRKWPSPWHHGVESALVAHPKLAEAAVVAAPTTQGQAISAFVSLESERAQRRVKTSCVMGLEGDRLPARPDIFASPSPAQNPQRQISAAC